MWIAGPDDSAGEPGLLWNTEDFEALYNRGKGRGYTWFGIDWPVRGVLTLSGAARAGGMILSDLLSSAEVKGMSLGRHPDPNERSLAIGLSLRSVKGCLGEGSGQLAGSNPGLAFTQRGPQEQVESSKSTSIGGKTVAHQETKRMRLAPVIA